MFQGSKRGVIGLCISKLNQDMAKNKVYQYQRHLQRSEDCSGFTLNRKKIVAKKEHFSSNMLVIFRIKIPQK